MRRWAPFKVVSVLSQYDTLVTVVAGALVVLAAILLVEAVYRGVRWYEPRWYNEHSWSRGAAGMSVVYAIAIPYLLLAFLWFIGYFALELLEAIL